VDGRGKRRRVSFICKSFAKNPSLCKTLFNMAKQLKPINILELGTSLGISTMYLACADTSTEVFTVEGCPNTASIAKENFNSMGLKNVQSYVGGFDEVLPGLLERIGKIGLVYIDGNHTEEATKRYFEMLKPYLSPDSAIIFDDIHWSDGMEKAWSTIVSDNSTTMTIDMFHFGVAFFNAKLSKEHFIVRI
jgi:predicted O-methyltransferase YrrM